MLAQIHTHAHWAPVSIRLDISEAPPTLAFCKSLKEEGNCITGEGPVREETSNLKSFPCLQCSVWTTQQTSKGFLSVQSLVEGRDLSGTRAGAAAGRDTLPERPLSLAGSVLWLPSEASPGSRVLGEKALFAQSVCRCPRPAHPLDTVPSWLALTFPCWEDEGRSVTRHPSGCRGGTAGTSGPGLCLQPRRLGRRGGFFPFPALWSCSGCHRPPSPSTSHASSRDPSSNF